MWKFSEQKDRRTTLILGIFHCERAHSALRCLTYIPSVRHHVVYFCSGLSTTFHKINETASHFLFTHLRIPGARMFQFYYGRQKDYSAQNEQAHYRAAHRFSRIGCGRENEFTSFILAIIRVGNHRFTDNDYCINRICDRILERERL